MISTAVQKHNSDRYLKHFKKPNRYCSRDEFVIAGPEEIKKEEVKD
jgi:hypothetical protein